MFLFSFGYRKSVTPPRNECENLVDEILPTKGQAQSLKNRFTELEQDALKVETASSKIKYVPKRFVVSLFQQQRKNSSSFIEHTCT